MPDLPATREELEKTFRALVAARLVSVGAALDTSEALRWRVQERPHYVENEAQWFAVAGVTHEQSIVTGKKETRAVFISFDGFTERDEGKCDETILTLQYGFDVMFSIVERRRDGSSSHDEFTAYVMRAGASFKAERNFGFPKNKVEHKLLQTAQAARPEQVDFAYVHRINLTLAIEIDLGAM